MKISFFKTRIVLVLFFITVFSSNILAQEKQQANFWSRVRFGGGIGLSFGNGFFSGTLAPSAVYDVNKKFSVGLGLNGTYNKQRNLYSSTILGGSVISLFNVIDALQLSAEFEALNVSRKYEANLGIPNDNYLYPALFLGAGYRSGGVTFGMRYDVLYDKDKSIYASAFLPFVRVFF